MPEAEEEEGEGVVGGRKRWCVWWWWWRLSTCQKQDSLGPAEVVGWLGVEAAAKAAAVAAEGGGFGSEGLSHWLQIEAEPSQCF